MRTQFLVLLVGREVEEGTVIHSQKTEDKIEQPFIKQCIFLKIHKERRVVMESRMDTVSYKQRNDSLICFEVVLEFGIQFDQ